MTPRDTFLALLEAETGTPAYDKLLTRVVELCQTETEQGLRVMFSVPGVTVDKDYLSRLFGGTLASTL